MSSVSTWNSPIRQSRVRNRYSTKRTKFDLLDSSIDRRKVKKFSNAEESPVTRARRTPSFTLSLNHLSKTRNTYFRGTGISIVFSTTTDYQENTASTYKRLCRLIFFRTTRRRSRLNQRLAAWLRVLVPLKTKTRERDERNESVRRAGVRHTGG